MHGSWERFLFWFVCFFFLFFSYRNTEFNWDSFFNTKQNIKTLESTRLIAFLLIFFFFSSLLYILFKFFRKNSIELGQSVLVGKKKICSIFVRWNSGILQCPLTKTLAIDLLSLNTCNKVYTEKQEQFCSQQLV